MVNTANELSIGILWILINYSILWLEKGASDLFITAGVPHLDEASWQRLCR